MKTIRSLVFWLISISLVFMSSGCTTSPSTDENAAFDKIYERNNTATGFVSFQSDNKQYSLVYPETWFVIDDGLSNPKFINPSLNNEPFKAMLAVEVVKPRSGLQFAAEALDQFLIEQPEISDFQKGDFLSAKINGLTGLEHITNFRLRDARYIQRSIFVQKADQIYVLTLLVLEKDKERYEPVFDTIIASLMID